MIPYPKGSLVTIGNEVVPCVSPAEFVSLEMMPDWEKVNKIPVAATTCGIGILNWVMAIIADLNLLVRLIMRAIANAMTVDRIVDRKATRKVKAIPARTTSLEKALRYAFKVMEDF